MKQTSGFISTYSADAFGVCSALFELGGMVVMHDASGCNSTYTTHDEPRWYDMDSMVYISGLTEIEAIMGDDGKLITDITEAAKELEPKFIAIAGTPIPAMTGFDVDGAASVIESQTGIPTFGFKTTGMQSYIHGAGAAFLKLAETFVKPEFKKTEKPSVNILGLTPLDFSVNGSSSSITEWLKCTGYEILSSWAMGSTLIDIEKSGSAHLNYVVSETGLHAAVKLKELFGIPYKTGIPIGGEDIDITGLYQDVDKNTVLTGFFHDVCDNDFSNVLEQADGLVIGEGISAQSLAKYLSIKTGKYIAAFKAPDTCEDDIAGIIGSAQNLKLVIADPLFKPLCSGTFSANRPELFPLPHEAFSGRLYRKDIPDLIKDTKFLNGLIKEITMKS